MDSLDVREASSVSESETLLEALSLDLMKSNIEQQIRYIIPTTTDFLGTVFNKFRLILEMDEIEDDDKREMRYQMVDFCDNLIDDIAIQYNLCVNEISDDYDHKMELLEAMYNFFVINRVNNIERFLIGHINSHKRDLIEALGIDDKSKDITSMSNKKKNISKENICVLSHIQEMIDFIRQEGIVSSEEFLEQVNDGEYYTEIIHGYFRDCTLGGNFVPILLNEVLDAAYDSVESARIRNTVRTAFID